MLNITSSSLRLVTFLRTTFSMTGLFWFDKGADVMITRLLTENSHSFYLRVLRMSLIQESMLVKPMRLYLRSE